MAALVAVIVCCPGAVPAVVVYRPAALMVPAELFPPATPSTDQEAAPPPGTVAVNCCDRVNVMAAMDGETVTLPFAMVTVTGEALALPPGPLHASK